MPAAREALVRAECACHRIEGLGHCKSGCMDDLANNVFPALAGGELGLGMLQSPPWGLGTTSATCHRAKVLV